MRIDLPIYTRIGPKIKLSEHGAYAVRPDGGPAWSYDGRKVTGKGIYVCATARGGTVYMSKVLSALGYRVGHEQVDEDGSVGYHLAVIRPDGCFHQTRDPLKQIASMVAHRSWGFIEDVIDIPRRGLLGCMTYWLEWNKLCEEFCVWRYQIEQLPEVWGEFLERIGHDKRDIPNIPRDENSSTTKGFYERESYSTLSWGDLFTMNRELAQAIYNKAKEYGYDVPEMDKTECQNLGELETAQVASV